MSLIQKPLKDMPRGMKRFRARFICHALSFHLDLNVYLCRVLNQIFLCRGNFYYLLF